MNILETFKTITKNIEKFVLGKTIVLEFEAQIILVICKMRLWPRKDHPVNNSIRN